mmetsp:Transcript_196/g.537  ORF Transcript_196/g.537 Transcript_196/m.537 type:complete len:334 (-) Transcript_196:3-1004(-)
MVQLAVAPHGDHGHVPVLEGLLRRHQLRELFVGRGIFLDALGPLRDADVGLQDGGLEAADAELALQLRIALGHVLPHAVHKGVPILSDHALALEGQVPHRVPLQVVGVPDVVAAGEELLAVHGDDLGVVPAEALAPGPHPQLDTGLLAQPIRQLLQEITVVRRHADDVPREDAHDHVVPALVKRPDGALHGLEKLAIRRAQAREVHEPGARRHELPHPRRELVGVRGPAVVVDLALPIPGGRRLGDVALHGARVHVPADALVLRVLRGQHRVGGAADVGQPRRHLLRKRLLRILDIALVAELLLLGDVGHGGQRGLPVRRGARRASVEHAQVA